MILIPRCLIDKDLVADPSVNSNDCQSLSNTVKYPFTCVEIRLSTVLSLDSETKSLRRRLDADQAAPSLQALWLFAVAHSSPYRVS